MKRIRVVLDTNVVVSAHLNSQGYERHVLDLVLAAKLQLAASQPILRRLATRSTCWTRRAACRSSSPRGCCAG